MDGIADSGIAVELSTAGLRKHVGEMYPAPAFLEMCLQAGAPVALSSDAHRPEDVGAGYEQALELLERLRTCGELCVFERRSRTLGHRSRRPGRRCGDLAGIGYDSHRLAEGRRLMIGGVEIPQRAGPGGPLRRGRADPCGDRRAARRRRPGRHRRALPRHRRALARRRLDWSCSRGGRGLVGAAGLRDRERGLHGDDGAAQARPPPRADPRAPGAGARRWTSSGST